MPSKAYFAQECPTCGRSVQIRVQHLGRRVACRHCHGEFRAVDGERGVAEQSDTSLLKRADALLASFEARHQRV